MRAHHFAFVVLVLVASALSAATSAEAYSGTGTVMPSSTQRMTGPHLSNYRQVGTYTKGQRLTLTCYVRGQYVSGYYGGPSNLWYRVSDGYYVADIDLNTGSNNPVASACPSSTPYRLPFRKGTRYQITQGPAQHAAGLYPTYNRHAVDFAMPSGTPVLASRAGSIYFEGYDSTRAIQVRISHGNNACTQYVHLSRSIVDRGQKVARGQLIGYSGATGISYGAHLHWNMVYCDSAKSRAVIKTQEMGTSYPVGMSKYSRNG